MNHAGGRLPLPLAFSSSALPTAPSPSPSRPIKVNENHLTWAAPAKLVAFLKTLPRPSGDDQFLDLSKAGQVKLVSGEHPECASTGCCLEAPSAGEEALFKPCFTEGYEDGMERQLFTVSFPYTAYIRRLPRGLLDTFTNKMPLPAGHARDYRQRRILMTNNSSSVEARAARFGLESNNHSYAEWGGMLPKLQTQETDETSVDASFKVAGGNPSSDLAEATSGEKRKLTAAAVVPMTRASMSPYHVRAS